MAANTRLATAVQVLGVLAYRGDAGATAEIVSRSLRTNPVVVRRLLKSMQGHGLVDIRPGKSGGVQLRRSPDAITLDQIYRAVEPQTGVFALRPASNPLCPVDRHLKTRLPAIFDDSERALLQTLAQTTLASLMDTLRLETVG